jgi:hypothetical protein
VQRFASRSERFVVEKGGARFVVDLRVEPGDHDEDRIGLVIDAERAHVSWVLADGAGNSGRGRAAAEQAAAMAGQEVERDPIERLSELDRALARHGSEAAVILAEVDIGPDGVALSGACPGDARIWALSRGVWLELSAHVPRKPLLGAGASPGLLGILDADALLCTSDGLTGWPGPDSTTHGDDLVDRLVAAARLPSGRLPDDVSIVWMRRG